MTCILVTGSSGLIGSALSTALRRREQHVLALDLRGAADLPSDVRDLRSSRASLESVSGIVHLAAVSRVVDGERDPQSCWSVNVDGTRAVLDVASRLPLRPWVIYASSREVYGEQPILPVREDVEQRPMNIYARSKVASERLVEDARCEGMSACTLRFSNVYGSVHDHADRVVPAFAAAAARGGVLRVDDPRVELDFTHISDVVDGVMRLTDLLNAAETAPPPPVHLTTGVPTSLGRLAELARELGQASTSVVYATPRSYDVRRFCGDPSRARAILGWTPRVDLRTGFTRLVKAFSDTSAPVKLGNRVADVIPD